jgi:uncharacterized protein (TIGR03118 family)
VKNITKLYFYSLRRRAFSLASAFVLVSPAALLAQHYQQANLVSDISGFGATTIDPYLKNPWGIARGATTPWWVGDNGTGVSTLYNAAGTKVALTVTIPHTALSAIGTPTGVVFNGSPTDFAVSPGNPTHFIFVSLDGTISAWFSATEAVVIDAVAKVQGSPNSVLTGAAIAQVGDDRFLFVADLKEGKIKVYDTNFNRVKTRREAFEDDDIPKGFAPFNVQNIGGNLYVAYAQQNQAKDFVVFGAGLGFVDVFSARGRLLQRLECGDWFNAPWGLTLAPSDFGSFSHKLIVGQFGSGEILAFDAVTGRFEGRLRDQSDNNIVIDGLWGISFGAGQPPSGQPPIQTSGPGNALFFAAGPNQGNDGLFGTLTPVSTDLIQGNGQ